MEAKSHSKSVKNRSENREASVFKTEVRGRSLEMVGGSGVDPGRRGRGGGKPPPEYRREFRN